MKIHIFSDLHLEGGAWTPPDCGADIYLVAGDLCDDGVGAVAWCKALATARQKPVLFVPGNHEYYGSVMSRRLLQMHRACQGSPVVLLANRVIDLGGVRFVGTTLWTDFALDGVPFQSIAMNAARDFMADFSTVFYRREGRSNLLSPAYTTRLHERARRALERGLEEAYERPVVVATHHAPSGSSVNAHFHGSATNPAFASNLDMLVGYGNARLWVHGHMHDNADYLLGATRVLCNPRGYHKKPNPGFIPDLVVEVSA